MTRWTYMVVSVQGIRDREMDVELYLDSLGEDGWELVAVANDVTFYLKCPLPQDTAEET